MSFIYMLKSKNLRGATKTYKYRDDGLIERTHTYNAGYEFMAARLPREGELDTIEKLSDLLKSAEDEPEWFAIRGELRSGQEYVDGVNRQYLDKNADPHWMEPEGGQRWLTLDMDGMEFPISMQDASPREVAVWVASKLPAPFHGVSFHYHHSASAGLIKVGDKLYRAGSTSARVHLSYIIDRPVCSQSLRAWVKKNASEDCPIDAALFNPVQPHFTADPIFVGGPDPLAGERSGLVILDMPHITAPPEWMTLEDFEQSRVAEQKTVRMFSSMASTLRTGGGKKYLAAALRSAAHNISSAREGERHATVYRESAAIGELVHRMDEHEAIRVLTSAAQATVEASRHADMERTVLDAIEQGKLSPRDEKAETPVMRDANRHAAASDGAPRTLAEIKVDRFRHTHETAIPEEVRENIMALTSSQQREVYTVAESYVAIGWSHCVPGPINALDAILTAHTVVKYDLNRNL